MSSAVSCRILSTRIDASHHAVTVVAAFKKEFDTAWASAQYRLAISPPKKAISALNAYLQSKGYRAVSITGLAREHRKAEIDLEMRDVLEHVVSLVAGH